MNVMFNILRLKLVDRLILNDLIPKLIAAIAAFSLMLLILGPLLASARFQAAGIPWWIIAKFVGWDFTAFVRYTFPMGMLLAALLGFDRISRDSEGVALFAGGISLLRIMVPVVGLGLVVSLVNYAFNDQISSYAAAQVADFNNHRQDIVGETTKPFDIPNHKDGKLQVLVHVEKGFDAQAKVLRQVTITFYDADGRLPRLVTYADRAKSHGSGLKEWTLYNVTQVDQQTGAIAKYKQFEDTIGIQKTPENMAFLQRDPETLNFHDLRRQIAELKAGGSDSADVRNAEVGLWFKISLPFSCLVFALVGAPLGLRPPRSGKISGYVWALPIMLGYYVIYTSMSSIAIGGSISPILAAWLPNILGLGVGTGLIWGAAK